MPSKDGSDPLQDARDALGEFILDGDFSEVMAAGLGAIYSLLPSKLRVPPLAEQHITEDGVTASASGGMHLGGGDTSGPQEDEEETFLLSSADPEVRTQIDLLLKLFGFLQDIIHRCNSPLASSANDSNVSSSHLLGPAIAEAILDALQRAFLESILYPAILECSSKDGSAVAVMTYLDIIFSQLDDGPLLQCMLDYLMDTKPTNALASRRSSGFGLLDTIAASKEYVPDESKFTLKDLILDNMRSDSAQAATAALRLLDTLLREHCGSATQGVLRTIPLPSLRPYANVHRNDSNIALPDTPPDLLPVAINSTDAHLQEIELYGNLISRIDPLQTSAEVASGYSGYLTDIHAAFQNDGCYLADLTRAGDVDEDAVVPHHRLHPSDMVIRTVLDSLSQFMCQSSDTNVALSGVIISLAMCRNRSLSGWLLYDVPETADPWKRPATWRHLTSGSDSDDSDDDGPTSPLDRRIELDPFTASPSLDLPAVYQILNDLVKQIHRFRLDVDDFDRLLAERRQGLLFADHLDEAMNIMLDVEPPSAFGTPSFVTSPPRATRSTSAFGSLKSFLTPKRKPPESSSAFSPSPTPASIRDQASRISGSPFKTHYDHVSTLTLEASTSSPITIGPWSPAKTPIAPTPDKRRPLALSQSIFGTPGTPPPNDDARRTPISRQVSLSQVLDNCVILEEFLKELASVITARRALGVDQVGFI